ncbi:sigma-70 family RNA polymerase sigma factor [Pedobacter sp. MC2016-14]|uniref:RNA polymerase sigma factor n=1 Tax=Pedobacter sp. MC2016-14 TaxID=2897327 RepID=UPI001E489693|nr:sigma-70 family RNA polymerase sigma factor [Pedobacter sp. MC2016-14]MCD0490119.1 sigma-70 family RNA polymerase sigma factor [Pedobacter sp. MC2016-14]
MQAPLETEEYRLLLKLQKGDQSAFNTLMATYKRVLAKRILYILKSTQDTEEVLQELFVRLWLNRKKIDPNLPIKAYLFHIGENLVIDAIRKANREKNFLKAYKTEQSTEAYSHIEETLYRKENRELLDKLIAQVPEQSRKVFTLCKIEGRSYDEVSQLLSISTATVNSHITKTNRLLRNYLKENEGLIIGLSISYIFLAS